MGIVTCFLIMWMYKRRSAPMRSLNESFIGRLALILHAKFEELRIIF